MDDASGNLTAMTTTDLDGLLADLDHDLTVAVEAMAKDNSARLDALVARLDAVETEIMRRWGASIGAL